MSSKAYEASLVLLDDVETLVVVACGVVEHHAKHQQVIVTRPWQRVPMTEPHVDGEEQTNNTLHQEDAVALSKLRLQVVVGDLVEDALHLELVVLVVEGTMLQWNLGSAHRVINY